MAAGNFPTKDKIQFKSSSLFTQNNLWACTTYATCMVTKLTAYMLQIQDEEVTNILHMHKKKNINIL